MAPGPSKLVVAEGERQVSGRNSRAHSLLFRPCLGLIQALQKEQISDLLNNFDGAGDAAGPGRISNPGFLGLNFTGDHSWDFNRGG